MKVRTSLSRRLLLPVGVAVLLATGLLWGIAGALAASSSPSPQPGKVVLRLGWTVDPDNLNPFIGFLSSSYEVWALNYDLMCGFKASDMTNPQGLKEAPGLAYKWTHSPDGKVWTFTVRSGVKWQDGVPFTASDVAFTYNYIIKNSLSNFTSYTTYIDRVVATDPTHVVFYCSKPKANMTALWVPILPEHIWSKIPGSSVGSSYDVKLPLVGTGPFQCVAHVKNQYVEMVANKNYWRGAPKIDEVVFQNYQNTDIMGQDLKSGAIQSGWSIPEAQFTKLGQAPLKAIEGATITYDELCFNSYTGKSSLGNKVLQDVNFRRALNWAIDKDKIVKLAYQGFAVPGSTIIVGDYYTKSLDWHWEPPAGEKYGFDIEKAKSLLTQAGYPVKNGVRVDKHGKPIVLRLWARTQSDTSQASGRLIAGWFRQLGLQIKFSVMDQNTVTTRQTNMVKGKPAPDFDMFLWGWGGDVDPDFNLGIFTTSQVGNWNDCGYSNPVYDKLYNEQLTALALPKRQALVDQMQEVFYHDSPYIVLAYPKDLESYNAGGWTGWVRSPAGKGDVWYDTEMDTYLGVHPSAATSTGGSSLGLIVGIIAGVVVVLGIVVWIVRRGRGKTETELEE